jgi:hypothetical protein
MLASFFGLDVGLQAVARLAQHRAHRVCADRVSASG